MGKMDLLSVQHALHDWADAGLEEWAPRAAASTADEISAGYASWTQAQEALSQCQNCECARSRRQVVLGTGPVPSRLMVVVGAPGRTEEEAGQPLLGASGELLDKMLQAMGQNRSTVYLTSAMKCLPPSGEAEASLLEACHPWLEEEMKWVQPEAVLLFGSAAVRAVLGESVALEEARGCWRDVSGRPVLATYHPATLVRDAELKKTTWSDLQMVMQRMGWVRSS